MAHVHTCMHPTDRLDYSWWHVRQAAWSGGSGADCLGAVSCARRRLCDSSCVHALGVQAERSHTSMAEAQADKERIQREAEEARQRVKDMALKRSMVNNAPCPALLCPRVTNLLLPCCVWQVCGHRARVGTWAEAGPLVAAAVAPQALKHVLKRMAVEPMYFRAVAVLYYWRQQARRQVGAAAPRGSSRLPLVQVSGVHSYRLLYVVVAYRGTNGSRSAHMERRLPTCCSQVEARSRWRAYAGQLCAAEHVPEPTRQDVMRGPHFTVAQRQVLRHADPTEWRAFKAITGAQVVRMVLQAWRAWTWIKQRAHQVTAAPGLQHCGVCVHTHGLCMHRPPLGPGS